MGRKGGDGDRQLAATVMARLRAVGLMRTTVRMVANSKWMAVSASALLANIGIGGKSKVRGGPVLSSGSAGR